MKKLLNECLDFTGQVEVSLILSLKIWASEKNFYLLFHITIPGKKINKARSAGFILPDVQWKLRAHEVCITHSNASSLFSFFFPVDNNGHCSKIDEEVIEIVL